MKIVELVGPGLLVDDVCATPFRYRGGALHPFERPELGVELDEGKVEAWRL